VFELGYIFSGTGSEGKRFAGSEEAAGAGTFSSGGGKTIFFGSGEIGIDEAGGAGGNIGTELFFFVFIIFHF